MKTSLAAAAAAGFLLALAFPPFNLDFLAWIAFVPLLCVLEQDGTPGRAPFYGAAFGIAFFMLDMNWIYSTLVTHGHFGAVPAVLTFLALIFMLAAFPAGFASAVAVCGRRGFSVFLTAPFIWTGIEYIRAVIFSGFPWDLAGYSQAGRLHVVQIADITGIYGISFLLLLVNGAAADLIQSVAQKKRPRLLMLGIAVLIAVSAIMYGQVRILEFSPASPSGESCPIGVLQGNIPQEMKWEARTRELTFSTYERLGAAAVREGARLLIWPETSVPVLFGTRDPDTQQPGRISEILGVPMLVGAPYCETVDGNDYYYNSALLMDGVNLTGRYDKIHLVPFGEYMPLSWLLPLGPGIAAREADYSPGHFMTVLSVPGCVPFSVLICYEAIFPDLARAALANGAQLLVNITNDGWFGDTGAPYQHLAMAKLRSVENRVWLLRSANTGISAAFDPAGNMVTSIPLQKEGYFVVTVPRAGRAGSFYCSFGDIFAWLCVAACGCMGLWCFITRDRQRIGYIAGH
ncbi:MAG TPA: apolipoprotein N-acyltransferase [Desulfomonilaceae bacterium]|nr:apolipoprotein N-acyltransferase [Desulfomonilaceae bacterium]